MIKVNYDTETTLVKGCYPDSINYASIPEPFIEITQEEHQANLGKKMCVIKGAFVEYVESDSVILEQAKLKKISLIKTIRDNTTLKFSPANEPTKNFILKISDLPQIAARASRLQDQGAGSKSTWSDINGVRQDLLADQFRSMRNHLDAHDETLRVWYAETKKEIEDCTTLEELNAININF